MPIGKRLYVDGLWLARHAVEGCDASLNWIDIGALARRAGCGDPINACYFGIFDPQDPVSAGPMGALVQALESQGVSCVIRKEPAPPHECTRCGHGWEHYPLGTLSVDLALAVAADAANGTVDRAVILTDAHTFEQLSLLFARCHPGRVIERFEPTESLLRNARLGRSVAIGRSITLLRPDSWSPPVAGRGTRAARRADLR